MLCRLSYIAANPSHNTLTTLEFHLTTVLIEPRKAFCELGFCPIPRPISGETEVAEYHQPWLRLANFPK